MPQVFSRPLEEDVRTPIKVYQFSEKHITVAIAAAESLLAEDMMAKFYATKDSVLSLLRTLKKRLQKDKKPVDEEVYRFLQRRNLRFLKTSSTDPEVCLHQQPEIVAESHSDMIVAAIQFRHIKARRRNTQETKKEFAQAYPLVIAVLEYKRQTGNYPVRPEFEYVDEPCPYAEHWLLPQKDRAPIMEAKVVAVKDEGTGALVDIDKWQRRVRMRIAD